MKKIEATIKNQEMLCVETAAGPTGFVVFGASGDLAHRKLFSSLYELYRNDLMSDHFYLIGCGRSVYSDETFRKSVRMSLTQVIDNPDIEKLNAFIGHFYYISGSYDQMDLYEKICNQLIKLDDKYHVDGNRIFYLSVPPVLYTTLVENLGQTRLSCPAVSGRFENVRLVIEKPFGHDLRSAKELDVILHRYFKESQIYRIDHYLGKETVQNLLIFRFANSIFEPVWNRNYIENVWIAIAEQVGVEHRAGYYEKSGALRDMFQNHMLQMLALVAMEPPTSFEADRVRDEKIKLLRSIRPFDPDQLNSQIIRAQYSEGIINGQQVPAYRNEQGVDADSMTETFVGAKLFIDNWRWEGVPFYMYTGKRLARKLTEIVIKFKQVPHSMFRSYGMEDLPSNILRFQIQPEEGMYLSLQAKRPGSKICMSSLEMEVDYQRVFGVKMPDAYERLLLDCMLGDQTLFSRHDSVIAAWELLTPVLEKWKAGNEDLYFYISGANRPDFLNKLL